MLILYIVYYIYLLKVYYNVFTLLLNKITQGIIKHICITNLIQIYIDN